MKKGYIVCRLLVHGSLQPVFSDDNGLMFFDTKKAARAEIKDCIDSIKDAIAAGNMDKESKETFGDYEILPATTDGEKIYCESQGIQYWMNKTDDDWQEVKTWESKKQINTTIYPPDNVPAQWDNVEVEAIKEDEEHGCSRTFGEGNPDFYSVYLHNVEGGAICIADCETEEQANNLADLIRAMIKNYKENGYLNAATT